MTKRINTLATIIAAFALTTLLEAQSPAGKWLASLPNGTIMALDLTTSGNAVTGTMFVETPSGAISASLTKVSLTGTTLSFSVSLADKESAFTAEIADGEIRLRSVANAGGRPLILKRVDALPSTPTATPIVVPPGWRSATRSATVVEEAGRSIVRIDERAGEGVVWRENAVLQDGIIEVEMRGKDVVGQSFIGLAFRGLDDTRFDVVYFRPFNFKTEDSERRLRAVQYHSNPDYPWARLRAEKPNQYEKPVSPVPDPNGWFKARVVLDGQTVNAFVNDSAIPTLSVSALGAVQRGAVGLWVGNGSGGDFANLKITPKP